jgi:Co/Zn/Cd efflux system component
LALLTNGGVAAMLYRFRSGDANMRSAWICARNDAIGNLAVLLAAAGVFGTGTGWPDIIVAAIMAVLGLSGGYQIIRQALQELHSDTSAVMPSVSGTRDEAFTSSHTRR